MLGNLEMSRKDGSCVAGGISLPLGTGSEAAAIDHFSFFVARAVVVPDISKVDTDRHLNPGLSAWDVCDEVLRWLFHG